MPQIKKKSFNRLFCNGLYLVMANQLFFEFPPVASRKKAVHGGPFLMLKLYVLSTLYLLLLFKEPIGPFFL